MATTITAIMAVQVPALDAVQVLLDQGTILAFDVCEGIAVTFKDRTLKAWRVNDEGTITFVPDSTRWTSKGTLADLKVEAQALLEEVWREIYPKEAP